MGGSMPEDAETTFTNPAPATKSPVGAKPRAKPAKKKQIERPFPRTSLERAIALAKAIKTVNAGNPMETDQVAKAIGLADGSSGFFYAASAAAKFGLAKRENGRIALMPLGRELVYAPNPDVETAARKKAFLTCDLFRRFLEYYKSTDLPEMEYVSRVLESEFQLERSLHAEFVQTFLANCKFLGVKTLADAVTTSVPKNGVHPAVKIKVITKTPDDVVVVADTEDSNAPTCFVIMPFTEKGTPQRPKGFFDEVLHRLIVPAATKAGFRVETARKKGTEVIHFTIINSIMDADLVVADLTDHNPNVLCELGMRLMHNKPVAILRAHGTHPIFDVDNVLRVEEYDPNLWVSTIDKDLPKIQEHIEATWLGRDETDSFITILRKRNDPTASAQLQPSSATAK